MSRFRELTAQWSARGILPSLSPKITDRGADYRYDNPFMGRFIDVTGTAPVLRGMDRCIPSVHPIGWDFSDVSANVFGNNTCPVQLRTTLSGCGDDENEVNEDEEIFETAASVTEPANKFSTAVEHQTATGK